jgi:hypothetical protein
MATKTQDTVGRGPSKSGLEALLKGKLTDSGTLKAISEAAAADGPDAENDSDPDDIISIIKAKLARAKLNKDSDKGIPADKPNAGASDRSFGQFRRGTQKPNVSLQSDIIRQVLGNPAYDPAAMQNPPGEGNIDEEYWNKAIAAIGKAVGKPFTPQSDSDHQAVGAIARLLMNSDGLTQ